MIEFFATKIVPIIWGVGIFFGGVLVVGTWLDRRKYKKFDKEQLAKSSKKNNK